MLCARLHRISVVAKGGDKDTQLLVLGMWNPSCIPKVMWLTIVGRNIIMQDASSARRGGLTFRVIVHLDHVEGLSGKEGQGSTCAFD